MPMCVWALPSADRCQKPSPQPTKKLNEVKKMTKERQTRIDDFEIIPEELLEYDVSDLEPFDRFNDLIDNRWDNNTYEEYGA